MLSCLKVSPLHCLCWSYLCLAYAGLIYAGCLIVQTDAKSEAGNSCHKTHDYNPGFATPNLRIIHLSASFTCDPDMVMVYGWWRWHDYNPIAGSSHRHPRELLCYVIRGEFRIGVPNRRHQQQALPSQSSQSTNKPYQHHNHQHQLRHHEQSFGGNSFWIWVDGSSRWKMGSNTQNQLAVGRCVRLHILQSRCIT